MFTILKIIGPGIGSIAASESYRLVKRIFATPIFIVRTLWSLFTFFLEKSYQVITFFLPWMTGWLQSTFAATERIKLAIDGLATKTVEFFEGQNPFIRFWFQLAVLSARFVLDCILAVYLALPHIFAVFFLIYVWFFIGYPLMYVAASPQAASDNLNVYFEGVTSLAKLFTILYNTSALIFNVLNPFFQNTLAFFAKQIAFILREVLSSFTFENTGSVGGGSRNARETLRDLGRRGLSSQFTPNAPELQDANIPPQGNPWTTPNDGWEISERVFLFAESPIVAASYSASAFLLIIRELFFLIIYPIIDSIIQAAASGGETASCCFLSDGDGWAVGYCVVRFFLGILITLVKLIGLSTPGIINGILDLLPKNPPPQIPCRCSGVLKPVPPCRPPLYGCVLEREVGTISFWQETVSKYKSVSDQGKVEKGASNPQKSVACPNYMRQEQRLQQQQRRGLEEEMREGEVSPWVVELRRRIESCETICHRVPGKGAWLVEKCLDEAEYKGPCENKGGKEKKTIKQQVIALLQTKPDFLTPGQRQKLLHKHTYLPPPPLPSKKDKNRDTTTTPPPTVYFESLHKEEDNTIDNLIVQALLSKGNGKVENTLAQLRESIAKIEQIPIDGCPTTFSTDYDFPELFLRLFCLFLRTGKLPKEEGGQTMSSIFASTSFPRHLAYTSNITELVEYHATWYHEASGGKTSMVSGLNHTVNTILQNAAAQLYEHKKADILKDRQKAKRRDLQADPSATNVNPGSNPLTSEGPFCPYKCPAGECVARNNIASCKLPANWTVATTTRFIAYSITATTENFDGQYLLEDTVSCWAGYIENPATDPFTLRGFYEYLSGSPMLGYKYCFPSFQHIPYLPDVTFKFNTYIQQLCAPNIQLNGPNAISNCFCTQYNNIDVFNYAAWTTIFTPAFVTARAFNAWKAIQWLLIGWATGYEGTWWSTWAFAANPQQSPEIIYAFSNSFVQHGQSSNKNWICAAVHSGEVAFFLILFYILWIIYAYLSKIIFWYFVGLLKLFIVGFLLDGLTYLSIYLYTEGMKKDNNGEVLVKLKVPKTVYSKSFEV
jgi:hypothetical protein